jgi:hypothetical protein
MEDFGNMEGCGKFIRRFWKNDRRPESKFFYTKVLKQRKKRSQTRVQIFLYESFETTKKRVKKIADRSPNFFMRRFWKAVADRIHVSRQEQTSLTKSTFL